MNAFKKPSVLAPLLMTLWLLLSSLTAIATPQRPNIVLIVADDMGWTDLGSYGSEINTPNIDAIARQGALFTDFHTSMSCSPTRSMLLSGTDNHLAGLGNMGELLTPAQRGKPGYEGYLNNRVASLAEVLGANGYHAYMAGKWHLGHDKGKFPFDRGFDRSFSMLLGGSSYWSDRFGMMAELEETAEYVLDGERLTELPKDFYSTRSYTDFMIDAIRSNRDDGKPFLAYLAYTSPHDPLHVPEPWLSQYRGRYDEGYEVLKSKRTLAAQQRGLTAAAKAPERYHQIPAWESLTTAEKAISARGMEVYAGMVTNLDYHIGRVIGFLKDIGELDNTLIIFLSDNGPNPWSSEDYPGNKGSQWFSQFDNSLDNIGHPMSHYAYGMGWGAASAGPLDLFKMTVTEGGIRAPLIIAGPGVKSAQQLNSFAYVWDIMPTILDAAGIQHPYADSNKKLEPMRGKSLAPVLDGSQRTTYGEQEVIAGEMLNGKWVRQGTLKAVSVAPPYGDGQWQLFDLSKDPGETTNLSEDKPEVLKNLQKSWQQYARDVGVVMVE